MNEEICKKNLDALKKNDEFFYNIIAKQEFSLESSISLFSEKAVNGKTIFKTVNDDGRVLFLEGKYNPDASIKKWILGQKKFENKSVIIIIGFGNGNHIKELIEKTKDSSVLMIYEPCINIFMHAMREVDLSEVFESKKIALFVEGINTEEMKTAINMIIIFDTLNILHHYVSDNYYELFPERIKAFFDLEKKQIEVVKRHYSTVLNFADVAALNLLNNIRYIYDNYTTHQLKNILPSNIPCIIVAAGPSLNKNIDGLKEVKNRACIIATDTALKPLLNRGIIPDFLVMVDGKKPAVLFEHERLSEVPLVMSALVSREPVNMHKGRKFFSWEGTRYETDLIKVAKESSNNPDLIDLISIPTGGSVATTAFSFACILGSRTIILMGQDLALTGNKTHADGTFKNKMEELDMTRGNYIEVEDIYGNMVLTRPDYKSYLDWFNEYIPKLKEVNVIDATEGGAKIKGTEILTLKEAVNRECKNSIDVGEILERIQPVFYETNVKEKIRDYLNNTVEKFDEVKEKANRGIGYYEKIIDICSKKNFNSKEYVKISKKVSNIMEFLNNDAVALLVIDSMRQVDYSLRAIVYNTEDKEEEERLNIAKHGKVYLENMIKCIEDLKPYAEETVGKVGM